MASQYDEMMYEQAQNRSPGTSSLPRGYGTINRQPSRQFDAYGQASLYAADDLNSRYDVQASRLPPPVFASNFPYDANTWAYSANAANANAATMGASRIRASTRRAPIPNSWAPEPPLPQQYSPMPGVAMNGFANGFPNGQHIQHPQHAQPLHRPEVSPVDGDGEELIPTAIVIKNIPFAVKKEQLQNLMQDIGLPVPYAFNYHFDNGVFRGLAFANFQNPEDTKIVIENMNHMELQGRKLRVEYKKMLPLQERERIEREKRERRGQLEEQHRPVQGMSLHSQASMSSLSSALPGTSPSPVSMRVGQTQAHPTMRDVNMNDPQTLEYYGKILVFKDDPNRKVLIFSPPLSPANRKVLHSLSHYLGLHHSAVGTGESRHIQIFKEKPNSATTPDLQSPNYSYTDPSRRVLNRAATIDFSDSGVRETGHYHTLRTQTSNLLDIPGSPGLGIQRGQSLREAKSFGDLQSRRASPALSSSSFPANLTQNVIRYNEHGTINGQSPNGEIMAANGGYLMNGREETVFANGFSNLSLGFDRTAATRSNGRLGMGGDNYSAVGGAIGSQRSHTGLNGNYDELSRNGGSAMPERQPRGPGAEWGSGFTRQRQNGHVQRSSEELDLNDIDQSSDRNAQNTSTRYM